MNEHCVSIKVDREERPDIDHIHMQVTQAISGSGGWPMTVVMTPDREPFFAGTYFPKHARFGHPGMMELLPRLAEIWRDDRARVTESAGQITQMLRGISSGAPGEALDISTLELGASQLAGRFDSEMGGFGSEPKFPTPHNLLFLLRRWKRTGDPTTLEMVETTLRAMRRGGVFDHVGFGWHRYSTDREWLLPHFEKMLYDQALMTCALVEAYQATGNALYADVARETLTYVLRDMTSPEGGFYSAEDADSEGEEGLFYVWPLDEVREVLGEGDGDLFIRLFHLEERGNFVDQASRERTGRSIPHLQEEVSAPVASVEMSEEALLERIEEMRARLFEVRERREHPLKDDKVLTDWNGLMIAAMAKAGRALDEPRYTEGAARAAAFVWENLRDDRGRLVKRWRNGEAGLPAHLEDYAFFTWGLIELYESTGDAAHLRHALEMNELMLKHFWDDEAGGLFLTADDGEALLVRPKEIYDGATPSGNSVAALNLLRLARLTGNTALEERANAVMRAFSGSVRQAPMAHTFLMTALDFAVGPTFEVVIAGDPEAEDTRAMLRALHGRYLPNMVVVVRPPGEASEVAALAPYAAAQTPMDGKATAYVCENFVCNAPTDEIGVMLEALGVE
jgi:hypothetical protein